MHQSPKTASWVRSTGRHGIALWRNLGGPFGRDNDSYSPVREVKSGQSLGMGTADRKESPGKGLEPGKGNLWGK